VRISIGLVVVISAYIYRGSRSIGVGVTISARIYKSSSGSSYKYTYL
jgi:hypothetical protein